MKKYSSKLILVLWVLLCIACSDGEESDDTNRIQQYLGSVWFYDTDRPISGLELKVKFYHARPNAALDESLFITMVNTTTDAEGKFSFKPELPRERQAYWTTIEVASEGLSQVSESYPFCIEPIQALYVVGQEDGFNPVDFSADSVAYLQIEFDKVSSTDETVVYYGKCGQDYYSTLESPHVMVTETFPTFNTANTFERFLSYDVFGSGGVKSLHVKTVFNAGKTTLVKVEY